MVGPDGVYLGCGPSISSLYQKVKLMRIVKLVGGEFRVRIDLSLVENIYESLEAARSVLEQVTLTENQLLEN